MGTVSIGAVIGVLGAALGGLLGLTALVIFFRSLFDRSSSNPLFPPESAQRWDGRHLGMGIAAFTSGVCGLLVAGAPAWCWPIGGLIMAGVSLLFARRFPPLRENESSVPPAVASTLISIVAIVVVVLVRSR